MKTKALLTLTLMASVAFNAFSQQILDLFDVANEPRSRIISQHENLVYSNGVATFYELDTASNNWRIRERITGVLDANGKQVMLKMEDDDSLGNLQVEVSLTRLLTYDGSNRISSYKTIFEMDVDERMVYGGNLTYQTNGNLNPIQGYDSIYDGTTALGFPSVDSIVYAGTQIVDRYKYAILLGNVIMQSRRQFTYTGSNLTELAMYEHDGSNWVYTARNTLSYDGSGNITRCLVETYDDNTSTWELDQVDSASYSSGKMVSYSSYRHNGTEWEFDQAFTYTYTGNNLNELYEKRWNGSAVVDYYKYVAYYTGNKIDSLLGYHTDGSGGWSSTVTKKIIFTPGPSVGLKSVVKNNLSVGIYPNPATTQVSFNTNMNGGTASVFNITGQRVMNTTIENNTLDISSLTGGIYFVTIEKDGNVYHSKLSVK